MNLTLWVCVSRIAKCLAERYDQYDGFVVAHGTDTMAFSASAISFLLQDIRYVYIIFLLTVLFTLLTQTLCITA